MHVANASNHDVDLDTGRVLIPRERATIDRSARHDQLIADRLLVELAEPEPDLPDLPAADPTTPAFAAPAPDLPWEPYDEESDTPPAGPHTLSLALDDPEHGPSETPALAPTSAASADLDPAAAPAAPQES